MIQLDCASLTFAQTSLAALTVQRTKIAAEKMEISNFDEKPTSVINPRNKTLPLISGAVIALRTE